MHFDIVDHGFDEQTAEILERAVIVTTVLAQLTNLDGRPRALTPSGTQQDVAVAELVPGLLQGQEIPEPLSAPYRYSIPDDAETDEPDELIRGVRQPLGTLAGQPTVVAELASTASVRAAALSAKVSSGWPPPIRSSRPVAASM